MTKFADQLYADLLREHGSALADQSALAAAAPPRRRLTSRRVLLAAGAGGLAAGGAAVLMAGGAPPAASAGGAVPAYVLTANSGGTVTLAVYKASGIAPANAKLRHLGDNVVIVPVRPGCPAINSLPAPAVPLSGRVSGEGSVSKDGSITVNVHGVPAGDILVVAVETTAHGSLMEVRLSSPPVPGCVSMTAIPGNGSGSGSVGG